MDRPGQMCYIYEEIAANRPVGGTKMEQNKALLERIRLFVLDLDGTIYLGDRLLPGAAEFITTAKEKGRQVLFFTNNTSRSPMEYVERLSRMGIPVTR